MVKSILLISYFSGIDGCCPAEWVDDKIDSLSKLDHKIVLISGLGSKPEMRANVIQYRVPSLSYTDLMTEYRQLKSASQRVPYSFYLMLPFSLTFGYLFDLFQKQITNGIGGTKFSWIFPVSFVVMFTVIKYRIELILTTGGPPSAHIAGILIGRIARTKTVIEFQDPLSGDDIGRNSRSAKLLAIVESLLVKLSNRVVYVTKKASDLARKKFKTDKIISIYPGARRFNLPLKIDKKNFKKLKMVHLGTLYSSRNMNSLIGAIDSLIHSGKIKKNDIEIVNLGEIYGEFKSHHLRRNYIKQVPIQPRIEALAQAAEFDMSLLIQHSDKRSIATIPYKTYDYLNISNPIMALTNNKELSNLLAKFGHYSANVNDVDQIAELLMKILNGRTKQVSSSFKWIDPLVQCKKLITI